MRELTLSELDQVAGAGWREDTQSWTTFGGTTGSVIGYIATSTVVGATRGGLAGAGIGFAWGSGQAFGNFLYENFFGL